MRQMLLETPDLQSGSPHIQNWCAEPSANWCVNFWFVFGGRTGARAGAQHGACILGPVSCSVGSSWNSSEIGYSAKP